MDIKAGMLLHSTAALAGDYFEGALVYLAEYNSGGAIGFVLNRPFGRRLNELVAFRNAGPFMLYEGGPVDTEHLFLLHQCPQLVDAGSLVAEGIFLGGNFGQAVAALTEGKLTDRDIRIFVGYCGWHAGDLEQEIAEGSWQLLAGSASQVFRHG